MERVKILFLLILFISGLSAKSDANLTEDVSIVTALLSEDDANYPKSQEIFLNLYKQTSKLEYLIQASREAMMYSGGEREVVELLKDYLTTHPNLKDLTPARMVVALYAKMGQIKLAQKFAKRYLSKSSDVDDLKLLATISVELKEYKEALRYLKRAYKIEPDDKIILDEVLLLKKLNKDKEAIKLIKRHIKNNPKASVAIYFKLIELYAKRKDLKSVLRVYKELYAKEQQKYFLQKIVKLSLYLKDFDGLIEFLEKYKGNEGLLYLLYKEQDRFDKAIALAKKRFKETKKPKWLAEEAILMYEMAHQKKKITPELLKKFQKLFDKALKMGLKGGMYLNYYGYVLIDHDLDIEKGIKLVKEALKQKPNNSFYLDSLAWGLYKLGKCQEAYKLMKRVIAKEGILQESEIKTHWESIRECKKSFESTPDMF